MELRMKAPVLEPNTTETDEHDHDDEQHDIDEGSGGEEINEDISSQLQRDLGGVPFHEEDTQEIQEGCERLQEQFRTINIYQELPRTAAATAARKVAAARKTLEEVPPSVDTTDEETVEEDPTPLETKADAKAFRCRKDVGAVVARMMKPAEQGIKYDIFEWVTRKSTHENAAKYFQENSPNRGSHATPERVKLSEEDMKSYVMQVSVALLYYNFCNSA